MSSQEQLVVDDRHPLVSYVGQWYQAGVFPEYNWTTSMPQEEGAGISFPFSGTSISVHATLGQLGHVLNCAFDVDGANVGTLIGQARNVTAYHTEVYSASFPDGSHTLYMNVTSFGPSTLFWADFYLDYILYTPSPSLDPPQQQLWSFDDIDPAFNYSGPWSTADGTAEDFQATLHRALSLNSSVSLQFNGTFIDVYGRLPDTANLTGMAQFIVDDGQPIVSNYPSLTNIYFDPQTSASSNYRLLHADSLAPGIHSLVIMPLAEDALWLDYINCGTGLDTINAESPQLTTPSAIPSPTPTGTATTTPALSQASSSSTHTHAALAGGIVGGIVCLALIVVLVLCLRRRRPHEINPYAITSYPHTQPSLLGKGSTTTNQMSAHDPMPSHTIPAAANPNMAQRDATSLDGSANSTERTWSARGDATGKRHRRPGAAPTSMAVDIFPTVGPPPSAPASEFAPSVTSPVSSMQSDFPIQHQDSGIRGLLPPTRTRQLDELPPVYSAA